METVRPSLPLLLLALVLCLLLAATAVHGQGQSGNNDFFTDEELEELNLTPPGRGRGRRNRRDRSVDGFRTDFLSGERRRTPAERQYQVRLVGGNSRQGNVEVQIYDWRELVAGWRSVCDIGWTQQHAEAVCKQLGFPGPAVATRNGRFGYRSTGFGSMVSHCKVGLRGLRDCLHDGLGATNECRSNNVAGAICGDDPATPSDQTIQVRLRNRSGNRGDVEVQYGNGDWGPACGDGFDLRDAMVVCRQLELGAAVRSYLSGRRASGAFILSGVECTGRETNLGQCRSERGASVTCPGNQYSGAAVECSGPSARALPDLVVDAEEVEKSAFIESQSLGTLTCALEENCLSDSAFRVRQQEPRVWRTRRRKLFRFTNKVRNIGGADYRPQTDPARWQWHSCHSHFHSVESFSEYDLTIPGTDRKAGQGHKASFCLEDSECQTGTPQRYRCQIGTSRERFPQGIRAGCADVYGSYIDCQWIDVTDIQSGTYTLRVRVNADRIVPEASFDNNQVECSVTLDIERERTQISQCRLVPL